MADLVPEFQKTVQQFRSKHGNTKVGEVTVDMVSTPPLGDDISDIINLACSQQFRGISDVINLDCSQQFRGTGWENVCLVLTFSFQVEL